MMNDIQKVSNGRNEPLDAGLMQDVGTWPWTAMDDKLLTTTIVRLFVLNILPTTPTTLSHAFIANDTVASRSNLDDILGCSYLLP